MIPQTYKEYHQLVEVENLPIDNVIMNTRGSVDIGERKLSAEHLYRALLFTQDKASSDKIIEETLKINVHKDFMDSRCHATGYWAKHNAMIVGQNPGRKGRALEGYYLKPSFIFTITSFYLRKAIELLYAGVPYITNAIKYATASNKVEKSDFDKCKHILDMEITMIMPTIIIALGNDVYSFLMQNYPNKKIIKIMHPAAPTYSGMPVDEYSNIWRRTWTQYTS